MILRFKTVFFLLIPLFTIAQSPEENQAIIQSAIDWLDSKLNYIYYDNTNQKWWNNTFYVNENNKTTVKHISSDRPNTTNMNDKTYIIRTFRIQDINPNSLKITKINESRGRIVKGDMLEMRTFGFQDLIHKTINNRKASSTSFLFLSFPETLIDSLSTYVEIVKEKFKEAIWASTQIYPSSYENDLERVLSILTGTYQSADGAIWNTELIYPNVLELDRGEGIIEYFGYNTEKRQFYLVSILTQGISEQCFHLKGETKLVLSSEQNQEAFVIGNQNSFTLDGQEFFRQ